MNLFKNKKNNNNKYKYFLKIFIFIVIILFIIILLIINNKMNLNRIKYSEFIRILDKNKIKNIILKSDILTIMLKHSNGKIGKIKTTVLMEDYSTLIRRLEKIGIRNFSRIRPNIIIDTMYSIIGLVLPFFFMIIFFTILYEIIISGNNTIGNIGKNKAKLYTEKNIKTTFKDVAGQDEAKELLKEIVDFLLNPNKYIKIGAKMPKGALLIGPPGTGKTLLAKAIAGEAKVPFFSLSGSSFVEMYVGVGASRVRDLFKEANKKAPCIIFIDEIDALGRSRDNRYGGNDERDQTLNQLLAEMDGFDVKKGIIILAATNRPEILDSALLRPGRFDRRIMVDLPGLNGRLDILKVHAKNVVFDKNVDLNKIAEETQGFSGADLANLINESAITAVRKKRQSVKQEDLNENAEIAIAGRERKDYNLNKEETMLVARHEVGHALIALLLDSIEPIQKITVIPRTIGSLGFVLHKSKREKVLSTREELECSVIECLAGRAAEEIAYDTITTGASNDIEEATKIIKSMITIYGMSDSIGTMGFVESDYSDDTMCSEEIMSKIDIETMKTLKLLYIEAKYLIGTHIKELMILADILAKRGTMEGDEFTKIAKKLIKVNNFVNIK